MNKKTELLILEALEMLLIFPESHNLEREKSLLIMKINQHREKLNTQSKPSGNLPRTNQKTKMSRVDSQSD